MAQGSALKPLAISIGDPTGIGPEILRASLKYLDSSIIFGPSYVRPDHLPVTCQWVVTEGAYLQEGHPNKESGYQAYQAFKKAAQAVKQHQCSALVTLPLAKEYVAQTVEGFNGHTHALAQWWGGEPLMMLVGGDLKVALVTEHISFNSVASTLSVEKVVSCGRLLEASLRKLNLVQDVARFDLLALNPHAGESRLFGDEESTILSPAVSQLNHSGAHWLGPHSADSFFARRKYRDAVLALYHDQGLIPVKMLAENKGVNVTLGLAFVRVSPDHGTAFDIAGQGKANPQAFVQAIKMAREFSLVYENEQAFGQFV